MRNRRLGGVATANLAFLRERVERQRSVVVPSKTKTGSLEDLNCDLRSDVENTRNSVERLDTQISTLHQDVATLSMEVSAQFLFYCPLLNNSFIAQVRNAIQALQEMTSPSSGPGSGAHSNPNITRIPCSNAVLARSTSHPPEIFCWDEPPSPRVYKCLTSLVDQETQTETQVRHTKYF